jgi:hypothetical protein
VALLVVLLIAGDGITVQICVTLGTTASNTNLITKGRTGRLYLMSKVVRRSILSQRRIDSSTAQCAGVDSRQEAGVLAYLSQAGADKVLIYIITSNRILTNVYLLNLVVTVLGRSQLLVLVLVLGQAVAILALVPLVAGRTANSNVYSLLITSIRLIVVGIVNDNGIAVLRTGTAFLHTLVTSSIAVYAAGAEILFKPLPLVVSRSNLLNGIGAIAALTGTGKLNLTVLLAANRTNSNNAIVPSVAESSSRLLGLKTANLTGGDLLASLGTGSSVDNLQVLGIAAAFALGCLQVKPLAIAATRTVGIVAAVGSKSRCNIGLLVLNPIVAKGIYPCFAANIALITLVTNNEQTAVLSTSGVLITDLGVAIVVVVTLGSSGQRNDTNTEQCCQCQYKRQAFSECVFHFSLQKIKKLLV